MELATTRGRYQIGDARQRRALLVLKVHEAHIGHLFKVFLLPSSHVVVVHVQNEQLITIIITIITITIVVVLLIVKLNDGPFPSITITTA